MNTELSPKEAKEILSLLKEGFNLTPPVQSAKPGMAPDYLGGGGAGGKAVMNGLKGLGQDIARGAGIAAKGVGDAVSGAANAVGSGFNKLMTPPAGGGNLMGQMTAGMAGARVPNIAQAAPKPVQPVAQPAPGPVTPAAPAPQENPAMQMTSPSLADRGISVKPSGVDPFQAKLDQDYAQFQKLPGPSTAATAAALAPQPAQAFTGDVTDQERQLLRKLHASNYNPNSKRDQQMLEHLRAAGREAGGYDDFNALRNLAYANQYGAKSDYGMLAQKWRDGRAQQVANAEGMTPKAGEYTVLTRRNTGVTTTEGNVWINPVDREWLSKSAAFSDLSWEDYCNLMPSDSPESIQTFFN